MDPVTISALTAAGTSLFNQGMSAIQSRKNLSDQLRWNKEEAELAYQREQKQIEEMRDYNRPVKQMERFEEAGLNPNLIYGQGTPGNVGSYATYQPAPGDFSQREPISVGDTIGEYMDIKQQGEATKGQEISNWLNENTKESKRDVQDALAQKSQSEQRQALLKEANMQIQNRIDNAKRTWAEKGMSMRDAAYIRGGILAIQALGGDKIDIENIFDQIPEEELTRFTRDYFRGTNTGREQ